MSEDAFTEELRQAMKPTITVTHKGETVTVDGASASGRINLSRGDTLTIDLEPILAEGMRLQREIDLSD